MPLSDRTRHLVAATLLFAGTVLVSAPSLAQSGEKKGGDAQGVAPAQNTESGKDGAGAKKIDEFLEAAQALTGAAGQPECVWLGRRVVNLLWRDDLDTAFRHLDLYDRFGCPGGHVQATFRCVVRQGNFDPKAPETLSARVHACWMNPELQPQAAQSAQAPAAGQPAQAAPAPAAQ